MFDALILLFYENPVAQLVGLGAVGVFSLSTLFRDDKIMLWVLTSSFLLWAIHFYLLDLITAAGIYMFMIIRNIFIFHYPKNKIIFYISVVSPLIILYFTYQGLASVLTIIPTWIFIYGVYYLKGIPLRISIIIISLFWLVHSILGGSIMGVLNEVIYIISGCFAIYKIKNNTLGKTI